MKKATIKTTTISEQITGGGRQTVYWNETVVCGGYKLRITIKSDRYAFQSHATIAVFNKDTLAWNEIHTITGDNMDTHAAYKTDLPVSTFAADRAELLRVAAEILGIE